MPLVFDSHLLSSSILFAQISTCGVVKKHMRTYINSILYSLRIDSRFPSTLYYMEFSECKNRKGENISSREEVKSHQNQEPRFIRDPLLLLLPLLSNICFTLCRYKMNKISLFWRRRLEITSPSDRLCFACQANEICKTIQQPVPTHKPAPNNLFNYVCIPFKTWVRWNNQWD